MSTDRGMDKDGVHIYNGILLSHKRKNETMPKNTDEPMDNHTKWIKSNRERQIWCHLYVEFFWKNHWYKLTYWQNRNKPTDPQETSNCQGRSKCEVKE